MASKTRIYEVSAEPKTVAVGGSQTDDAPWNKVFLIDAKSQAAAEKHAAAKYIGPATIPNGRRIADLMSHGVKVETAQEG